MPYVENPKTRGSGIICCIPQKGRCPRGCPDCFFQSGRSYLEPLEENTPNMPEKIGNRIVRVNDGNDSNNDRALVLRETARYPHRFYNTVCPDDLERYGAPVVLTVNPGEMTDKTFYRVIEKTSWRAPVNLMFVRIRTNTWNLSTVVKSAVKWWTDFSVPVVLTFMAYQGGCKSQRAQRSEDYEYRKRTLNHYYAITHDVWKRVMARYEENPLVHSCGIEGVSTACKNCGNCLREYWATLERMRG